MPAGYTKTAAAAAAEAGSLETAEPQELLAQLQPHVSSGAGAGRPGIAHRRSADDSGWNNEAQYLGIDLSTPRDAQGATARIQGKLAEPETQTRIVVVNVIQAKGLLAADSNGFSDPYVVLQLEGATVAKPLKTKVQKSTLDPVWDEEVRIPVRGRVGQLKLKVLDYDLLSGHDFLGFSKISLHTLMPEGGEAREKRSEIEQIKATNKRLRDEVKMSLEALIGLTIDTGNGMEPKKKKEEQVMDAKMKTVLLKHGLKDAISFFDDHDVFDLGRLEIWLSYHAEAARNYNTEFRDEAKQASMVSQGLKKELVKRLFTKLDQVLSDLKQAKLQEEQLAIKKAEQEALIAKMEAEIQDNEKKISDVDSSLKQYCPDEWLKLRGKTEMGPATGAINIRFWMEVKDEPPPDVEPRRFVFNLPGKKEDPDDVVRDIDDMDLGIYFNIQPPLDKEQLAIRKAALEREKKTLAKLLAKRKQQRDQENAKRPPWKDKAWEKWTRAGERIQRMVDCVNDIVGQMRATYQNYSGDRIIVERPSHALQSAALHRAKPLYGVIGWGILTVILMTLLIGSLYVWVRDFAGPLSTYPRAQCMAISAQQTFIPHGYMGASLSRGEVLVHVFGSTMTECCCPDQDGKPRCAEWQAVSYDSVDRQHSMYSKVDFVTKYGLPGSFYACWHSPDKQWVVLDRDWNTDFLWVPFMSLFSMCLSAYQGYKSVQVYRTQIKHYSRILDLASAPGGIMPEQAFMHEDTDFHPHPKHQHEHALHEAEMQSLIQHTHGEEDAASQVSNSDGPPKLKARSVDDLMKMGLPDDEGMIEEDEFPNPDEMNLIEWYNISNPVKGVLWRGQKLVELEQKHAAEVALWYTFVVFNQGGDRSVAEIHLRSGPNPSGLHPSGEGRCRASWSDMKARLVGKLGADGLLGVPRGKYDGGKVYCLQYIDPHQKAEKKKKATRDSKEGNGSMLSKRRVHFCGINLPSKDSSMFGEGTNDSYLEFFQDGKLIGKSDVMSCNLNPSWPAILLQFRPDGDDITVKCWDKDSQIRDTVEMIGSMLDSALHLSNWEATKNAALKQQGDDLIGEVNIPCKKLLQVASRDELAPVKKGTPHGALAQDYVMHKNDFVLFNQEDMDKDAGFLRLIEVSEVKEQDVVHEETEEDEEDEPEGGAEEIMGRVVLIRNEMEWQQCWEVALKEDDNELEVDIVELKPKDFLPTPRDYYKWIPLAILDELIENSIEISRKNRKDEIYDVFSYIDEETEERDRYGDSGSPEEHLENGGNWTDDEDDAGDDGPGRSPDVEMSNRKVLRHADMGLEISESIPCTQIPNTLRMHSRLITDTGDPVSVRVPVSLTPIGNKSNDKISVLSEQASARSIRKLAALENIPSVSQVKNPPTPTAAGQILNAGDDEDVLISEELERFTTA